MIKDIEEEIEKRGITRLCHITNSRSFIHIIQQERGIVANQFLGSEEERGILIRNDDKRLDGKLDYISCSIEYPNTWFLNRIRNLEPNFKDWVILFIDPLIMAKEETLFSPRNAAAGNGKYLKSGFEGLSELFKERVEGKFPIYRTPEMLECCPTDGQAEVMIYKNIPLKYINAVCVPSLNQVKIEKLKISHLPIEKEILKKIKWIVAPDLFQGSWNQIVRNGKRPMEQIVSEAEMSI